MSQQLIMDTSEAFADSEAVTTVSVAAVIVIDDNWLEAVLDHLALAKLSRHEGIQLIARLEALELGLERSSSYKSLGTPRQLQIVVGDHFDAELNEHQMRAPEAMTADNAVATIDAAAQHFADERHIAALKQLVFFISGNLEEVIDEDDELGED